jgi:hypothetical protein
MNGCCEQVKNFREENYSSAKQLLFSHEKLPLMFSPTMLGEGTFV